MEGMSSRQVTVGTVAALRAEKNISRLLRAFQIAVRSCDARLIIVGDGPERPRLEALTTELGLTERVQFLGYVTNPAQVYSFFDVFALSSDTEQMPLAVLEALASGLPVVATDVGDVRAMLCQENKAFVAPIDEVALADRMVALLENEKLRKCIGMANRAKAECCYSEQAMFRSYHDLFKKPDDQKKNSCVLSRGLMMPEFRSTLDTSRSRK